MLGQNYFSNARYCQVCCSNMNYSNSPYDMLEPHGNRDISQQPSPYSTWHQILHNPLPETIKMQHVCFKLCLHYGIVIDCYNITLGKHYFYDSIYCEILFLREDFIFRLFRKSVERHTIKSSPIVSNIRIIEQDMTNRKNKVLCPFAACWSRENKVMRISVLQYMYMYI